MRDQKKFALRAPYIPPDFAKILCIQPESVMRENDIGPIEPILQQLIFGDFSQLKSPAYHAQLFQIMRLLQFTAQYLLIAQDHYASQAELQGQKSNGLVSQNMALLGQIRELQSQLDIKRREPDPTPAFVSQSQQLLHENARLRHENTQLKLHLQEAIPLVRQLPQCCFCDKRFATVDFLHKHVLRRHEKQYGIWCKQNSNTKVPQTSPESVPPIKTSGPTTRNAATYSQGPDSGDLDIVQPQAHMLPDPDDCYIILNKEKLDRTRREIDEMQQKLQNYEAEQRLRDSANYERACSTVSGKDEGNVPRARPGAVDVSVNDSAVQKLQDVQQLQSPASVQQEAQYTLEDAKSSFTSQDNEPIKSERIEQELARLRQRVEQMNNDSFSVSNKASVDPNDDSFSIRTMTTLQGNGDNPQGQGPCSSTRPPRHPAEQKFNAPEKPITVSFNSEQSINSELIDQVEQMIEQMRSLESTGGPVE